MRLIFIWVSFLAILETILIWCFISTDAALSFSAAQSVMLVNLLLLTFLWRSILAKKKIAHISVLIVIKGLFLLSSAWIVFEKLAPLPIWAVGGFTSFFAALTFAGSLKRVRYEL